MNICNCFLQNEIYVTHFFATSCCHPTHSNSWVLQYLHHKALMAVDLYASSLSSSAAGALRLSWRLHGSYHQTRACVQNEEYINMDLPKARWKKLVITHCNFSSSIQSLLRFPTRLTENTSLSNCLSSCRHELVFTLRNKKNCSACGRSLFWQKPLLMEGDVLLIMSSLWNSQHHFPHCSNQICKDY